MAHHELTTPVTEPQARALRQPSQDKQCVRQVKGAGRAALAGGHHLKSSRFGGL